MHSSTLHVVSLCFLSKCSPCCPKNTVGGPCLSGIVMLLMTGGERGPNGPGDKAKNQFRPQKHHRGEKPIGESTERQVHLSSQHQGAARHIPDPPVTSEGLHVCRHQAAPPLFRRHHNHSLHPQSHTPADSCPSPRWGPSEPIRQTEAVLEGGPKGVLGSSPGSATNELSDFPLGCLLSSVQRQNA